MGVVRLASYSNSMLTYRQIAEISNWFVYDHKQLREHCVSTWHNTLIMLKFAKLGHDTLTVETLKH